MRRKRASAAVPVTTRTGVTARVMHRKRKAQSPVDRIRYSAGLAIDVRNETEDLLPWKEVGFEMITETSGDVYARNMVRLRELYVSIRIIENIINGLPESALITETKAFPDGEATVRLEAPRGELFYYAKGNKTQILERLKIKAPTFSNVAAMAEAFTGNEYGSAPAIIASYDPCLSCTAR